MTCRSTCVHLATANGSIRKWHVVMQVTALVGRGLSCVTLDGNMARPGSLEVTCDRFCKSLVLSDYVRTVPHSYAVLYAALCRPPHISRQSMLRSSPTSASCVDVVLSEASCSLIWLVVVLVTFTMGC